MEFFKFEIETIQRNIQQLEDKISIIEQNSYFNPNDIRYTRLLDEKGLLLKNLCDIRLQYGIHLNKRSQPFDDSESNRKKSPLSENTFDKPFSGFQDSFLAPSNTNPPSNSFQFSSQSNQSTFSDNSYEPGFTIDRFGSQPKFEDGELPSSKSLFSQPKLNTNGGYLNTSNDSQKNTLPPLQMDEYLSTKMQLAQIMRDFNEKRIVFLALDNSPVAIQQYQTISNRVKQGEDISGFLRGRTVNFVTGVDKKKKSVTETKLFIPDFELCR